MKLSETISVSVSVSGTGTVGGRGMFWSRCTGGTKMNRRFDLSHPEFVPTVFAMQFGGPTCLLARKNLIFEARGAIF